MLFGGEDSDELSGFGGNDRLYGGNGNDQIDGAAAFDSARADNPSLSRWALSSSLLQFHLGGSDSEAIGGDLAYEYGKHSSLTGLSLNAIQAVMADPNLGSQSRKQSLYNVT